MCLLNSKLNAIAGDDFRKEKSSITTLATILVVTYICVTLFAGLDRFFLGDIQNESGGYYAQIEETVFCIYGYLFPLFVI